MNSSPATRVRVWDPLVRVLHWSLVVSFITAWLTRHSPGPWHEWLGYTVLAIVVVRLAWGFAGTRYARFAQFVRGPRPTLAYAGQVIRSSQPRYLGHNPLGGWMIVALLVTTLGICISGWLYTTDRFWGIECVENLHDALSNLGIALAVLHVCGVIFGSVHDRENLVASMVHGRKRQPAEGDVE